MSFEETINAIESNTVFESEIEIEKLYGLLEDITLNIYTGIKPQFVKDLHGHLYADYDTIQNTVNELNSLISNGQLMKETDLTSDLKVYQEQFEQIGNVFDKAYDTIGNNFVNFQTKMTDVLVPLFMATFIIFLIIVIAIITFLTIYLFTCKNNSDNSVLEIVIHVVWNLCMFLVSCSLVLGTVFGIVAGISLQVPPVMNYLFSDEYLNSSNSLLGGGDDTGSILSVCLNGNANLVEHMSLQNEGTNALNEFYSSSQAIQAMKDTLALSNMPGIQSMKDYLTNLLKDYRKIPSEDGTTLETIVNSQSAQDCGLTDIANLSQNHFQLNTTCEDLNLDTNCNELCKYFDNVIKDIVTFINLIDETFDDNNSIYSNVLDQLNNNI